MSRVLQEALALAKMGIPVFPCRKFSKKPLTVNGFKDASVDPERITDWGDWRACIIGVPTGTPSGISVLDIDVKDGAQGDVWAIRNYDRLPRTRVHVTRSNGIHIVFKHADGVKNSASKIAPGVDVRGDGGYFIWWPAEGCEVLNDLPLNRLAPWPEWLIPPPTPPRKATAPVLPTGAQGQRYIEGAIRRAVDDVRDAPAHTRNIALNTATFSLCRFLGSGMITPEAIAFAMTRAGLDIGLEERETARTIESALKAGGRKYD